MKKLLVLLLVMIVCLAFFASCDMIPDTVMDKLDPVLDKLGLGSDDDEPTGDQVHVHDFVVTEKTEATCLEDGSASYACECGETKEEVLPAKGEHTYTVKSQKEPDCTKKGEIWYICTECSHTYREYTGDATGHNYEKSVLVEPTCAKSGIYKLTCTACGNVDSERIPATGVHTYDESVGASRILMCTEPACGKVWIREFNGKYKQIIVFTFTDDKLDAFDKAYDELDQMISSAEPYDATKHAFNTEGELYAQYLAMDAKYGELYDIIEYVTGQYQIAQVEYYMDMENPEKQENLNNMSSVRTDLIARFYDFSAPIYDSMYREFYYYGMTEEEINAFIADSDSVGNEEYAELNKRNAEIELIFNGIASPETSPQVPVLYEEFVANNIRIAELMGYDNYVQYAYRNVYSRDYEYTSVSTVVEFVKEYIVPAFIALNRSWEGLAGSGYLSTEDIENYYSQVLYSFFDNYMSNLYLNDYIDLLEFTSNPDKQISFSEELDKLFENGNYFRGEYPGAYVTFLHDVNVPITYFGPEYDNPFTVAHEFGHYMNEIYNQNAPSQSFDLLEMHSQGNELLFLQYLNGRLPGAYAYQLTENYNFLVMLSTIVTSLVVDTFEQAVYTNTYDGHAAAQIMADGTISASEYDLLFESIIEDFGATGYVTPEYWRYVTIGSPCYYVSYAISALSVLQLSPLAANDFDAAIDSYLKLFTYTDSLAPGENMTVEEVLEYAGLESFMDEGFYSKIYEFFATRYATYMPKSE